MEGLLRHWAGNGYGRIYFVEGNAFSSMLHIETVVHVVGDYRMEERRQYTHQSTCIALTLSIRKR